jgi:hypothetical protein
LAIEQEQQNLYAPIHHLLNPYAMRYFQVVLFCLMAFAKAFGQTGGKNYGCIDVEIIKEKRPQKIYTKATIQFDRPGGDSTWASSIENDLNQAARHWEHLKKGKYIVSLEFIIDKDSMISEVRLVNPQRPELVNEVMRVLKKRSGKWKPGHAYPVKAFHTSAARPKDE